MSNYRRHGDVCIVEVDSIDTKNLKKHPDKVLLEGEVTGHFHRLHKNDVWRSEPSEQNLYFLGAFEVNEEDTLTHEEHHTQILKPAKYKFYSQREFDPLGNRQVID